MSGPSRIDVLVVGLGPAGATAAAAAARAGARVLAIDRKRAAGIPVQCAELVPAMIGQDLAGLAGARRQPIRAMTTYVADTPAHHKEPFPGVMIDRAAFDAALVADAVAAGADCRLGVSLRTLEARGAALLSDGTSVRPRAIVGADGPRSAVGAACGLLNREIVETRQVTVALRVPFEATDIFLDPDYVGGYAWLFPKREVANLGLGIEPAHRHLLKPLLAALHARLLAEGRVGADVLAHTGGALPVGGLVGPAGAIGDVAVLLAGDAAGLANPVTGAGINPAVQSGTLAGSAAARIATVGTGAAAGYAEEIADTFGPSLARALARRRELLDHYARGARPGVRELRRAWIAFPEYWTAPPTAALQEIA